MEKIAIFNANNEQMQVEVVRYFSESNNKYFIFSLHELDAQGHMNIYVTKIVNQNGTLIGTNIIDDVEWTNVKTNLQRIIKENRANGNAVVNDLAYNELQNVKVADRRALKLLASSVDMLHLGYKSVAQMPIPEATNTFEQQPVQNTPQNVQKLQQQAQNVIPNIQNNQQPIQNAQSNVQNVQQPIQNVVPNVQNMQSPVQNVVPNVQNTPVSQPNVVNQTNDIPNIFGSNPQPVQNSVENAFVQPNNTVQVNNNDSISDNYKDLYFKEKENATKLLEENNRLTNELNSCKLMISDIKNILSRQ